MVKSKLLVQDLWSYKERDLSPSLGSVGSEVTLTASNYLDSLGNETVAEITSLNPPDLRTLLADIGLDKYMRKLIFNRMPKKKLVDLLGNGLKKIKPLFVFQPSPKPYLNS